MPFRKNLQYYKFSLYGFLKNLRFFDPFLILFFRAKGLSFLQIGTLYAAREIITNLLEIPTGIIADSIGRRRTMIASFMSYIIAFIIFYIYHSYIPFLTAMVFFSFGEAFRSGTHKAMIFEYLRLNHWEDQKVYYYGHTRSWSQMGSALSALIAGLIVFTSSSLNTIFLFSIIPYLLDLLLMLTYPKELDGEIKKVSWQDFKYNVTATTKDFIHSFKNKTLLKTMFSTALFSGFYKAVKDYLQPILKTFALSLPLLLYLNNKQREAVIIAIVYFIIYFLSSFASRYAGRFSKKFPHLSFPLNLTILLGFGFGIISGFFYYLHTNYKTNKIIFIILSIFFYLCIYLIENLRKPIGIAYIGDQLKKNIMAASLSAASQLQTIITAGSAVFLGFLADKFGLGQALIITSVFLLILYPFYSLPHK